MKAVGPVGAGDPAGRPIESLQENGVAVLVDSGGKPAGLLTVCDLDAVKRRVAQTGAPARADALFDPAQQVYTVVESQPLDEVAKELARRRLGTGIAVVDSGGRYMGYVFNRDVERALDDFVQRGEQEIEAQIKVLREDYPELRRRGLV